jgi:hypothetical protein
MRTVSSNHAASGCYFGISLPFLRHMATMDTLAALYLSICATGAGAASHVEAPARLVAQHQNAAKRRTVLALLRHSTLPHSVASDAKLLETSRGLGTGGSVASRHRAPAARGGEKMTVHCWNADSNKTFYMSVETTPGVYHPA